MGTIVAVKCAACGEPNNVAVKFGKTGQFECGKCDATTAWPIRDYWEAYEWAGGKPMPNPDRVDPHPLGDPVAIQGAVDGKNQRAQVMGCCVVM